MKLHVHPKSRAVQVSDDTRQYVEKKLGKLNKHFRQEPEVQFTQGFERGQHIVEVTVRGDGGLLRGQVRHSDLRAAVDSVIDKLETQLKRFKGKRVDGHRQESAIKAEAEAAVTSESAEDFAPLIVRRKSFTVQSMPPEEAARQMEMLGHNFFVFINEETQRLGVLYRRESGDYGLIDPKK